MQVATSEIRAAGIARQVTIQSFDWGALMRMTQVDPRLPLVALTNYDFLQTGQPGKSPWLGGLDIDDFGGDPIKAAASLRRLARSRPVHGFPQNGKVTDPDYKPYVTKDMVDEAHAARHQGHPVDRRRQADHEQADRRRRGRHDHRLPEPPARGHGRVRHEAAAQLPATARTLTPDAGTGR